MQHIAELEGIKLEKFSPLEKRKLEEELEKVKRERDLYKSIVVNNLVECSKVINLIK